MATPHRGVNVAGACRPDKRRFSPHGTRWTHRAQPMPYGSAAITAASVTMLAAVEIRMADDTRCGAMPKWAARM